MEALKVVPDVIPVAPEGVAEVHFPSGAKAGMGNKLSPKDVNHAPKVVWRFEKDEFYTICMTDPDAPSRHNPKYREWHHWLVVNIPENDISSGEVMSEYIGAAPPKRSGFHRYVILVYKQPEKLRFNEKRLKSTCEAGRGKFSINQFAMKYNFGNPIAGNFFQAEWDEYVPIIEKSLEK